MRVHNQEKTMARDGDLRSAYRCDKSIPKARQNLRGVKSLKSL